MTKTEGKKIRVSKWVFKTKEVRYHKPRLVVRGCHQEPGIDYEDTYSPVLKSVPMRALFGMVQSEGYTLQTFYIKTAFIYGQVEESAYMYPPEVLSIDGICRLKKCLYGMRQAPQRWNVWITDFLKSKGLYQLKSEPCIFKNCDGSLILGLYMDDGLVIGKNHKGIEELLENLQEEFEIRIQVNSLKFHVMEFVRTENCVHMNYAKTVNQLFKDNMSEAKAVSTPAVDTVDKDETEINRVFPY
ncbi:hypothetical protein PR048_011790 [Dryococelus australis]|uniref:Reverse transcriptase Ty1/copia-type domain-containing protein n=1 Tax=Dryococelus australis TaxID=614101 RepID=A0ABQ9HMW7_9NEOP|nr:hypothetical protein PR048_011790 [Dryococelus australis]